MTFLIIAAIVLVGGWFGFKIIAKRARAAKVGGISLKEAQQIEAHVPREMLSVLRAAAAKKVLDKRLRALEEYYYFLELERPADWPLADLTRGAMLSAGSARKQSSPTKK